MGYHFCVPARVVGVVDFKEITKCHFGRVTPSCVAKHKVLKSVVKKWDEGGL